MHIGTLVWVRMRDSQKARPSKSDGCVGSRFDISIGARRIANMRFVQAYEILFRRSLAGYRI